MNYRILGGASLLTAFATLLLAFAAFTPSSVQAAGGGSGGGGGGGGKKMSLAEQGNKVDAAIKGKPFEAF